MSLSSNPLSSNLGLLRAATVILVFVLMLGCSSGSGESSAEADPEGDDTSVVSITLWHALVGTLEEAMQEQLADYNRSQDNYRVEAAYQGSYPETLQAGMDAANSDNGPVLLQVYETGTATMLAAESLFLPLEDVMQQAGKPFRAEDYFPIIYDYFSSAEGELLSLPYNISTPVLFVNQDEIARAELMPTVSTRTWLDTEALLTTLRDRGIGCPMTTDWMSWIHLENLSAYHDRAFADQRNGFTGQASQLVFNDEFRRGHIARLRTWIEQGLFVYKGRSNFASPSYRTGECAVISASSASYAAIQAETTFETEIRPLPWYEENDAPQNTIIGGASLWVMAGRDDEEYQAAADFLQYLAAPAVQSDWHQTTGYLPITPAAYELTSGSGFYDTNPQAEIPVQQLLNRTPTENSRGIRLVNFVEIRSAIDDELERVWSGEITAETALDNAVIQGNLLLQ